MAKTLQQIYKRQNEHIAENYDRLSITTPKGTKERIQATGESLNSFIKRVILAELERLENGSTAGPADHNETRNAGADPAQIHQATRATDPQEIQEDTKPAPAVAPSLEELNAQLEQRRQEWQAVKPLLQEEEPEEDEAQDLTAETLRAVAGVPDPEPAGVSIRELAERAKKVVREEEEKRRQAAEQRRSDQENAVAQMLKSRS